MPDTVPVAVSSLDVARGREVLEAVVSYLDRLERDGSLQSLFDLPEGKAAAETWRFLQMRLFEQLASADPEATSINFTIDLPRGSARETITFIEAIVARGVASGHIDPEDGRFAAIHIARAYDSLIRHDV